MKLEQDYNILDAFNFEPAILDYNGIFDYIGQTIDESIPFKNLLYSLDNDYLFSHGSRALSHIMQILLTQNNTSKVWPDGHKTLSDIGIAEIGGIYINRYLDRLIKTYDALVAQYNPIENYNSIEEHVTHNEVNSKVTTNNKGTDNNTSVYGFNSTSAVPESTMHSTGETETSGSKADNYTDGTDNINRHGNIGVTTSQQMITAEYEMRIKLSFTQILYTFADELMGNLYFTDGKSEKIYRALGE